jgi:hypothetical protein
VASLAVATAAVAPALLGSSLASASVLSPSVEPAGSSCPGGTAVVIPRLAPAQLPSRPAAALPPGFGQDAADPAVRRALDDQVRWQTSLRCTPRPSPGIKQPVTVERSRLRRQGSYNWSGYQAQHLAGVTGATGEWRLRGLFQSPPSAAAADVSTWAGIGDGTTSADQLAQAGTDEHYTSDGTRYAFDTWYELYPQETEQALNFAVSPGDEVGTVVTYNPALHTVLFLLADYTTRRGVQLVQPVSGSVGTASAEWIVERPELCASSCYMTPLANFGHEPFSHALARVNGRTKSAQSLATARLSMFSCKGQLLARPAGFSSPKKFNVRWRAYGAAESC